jgi:hypothetical protein
MINLILLKVGQPPIYFNQDKSLFNFAELIGADYFEMVHMPRIPNSLDLIVDEEGLFKDPKFINAFASYLSGQTLYGDALLTAHDEEGDTLSIDPDQHLQLMEIYLRWTGSI